MRYYVSSYNGVLDDLKKRVVSQLATPREADAWVVWQDVQGSYGDLIETAKKYYNKPVFCVQHGANATSDYDAPNSFKFRADRFLCWGTHDYERMCRLGYKDRTVIVGCPLNANIKPRVGHSEKVVLFVPVNTGKEEPENLAVYYELLKIKYHKAQTKLLANRVGLKDKWGFNDKRGVAFNELSTEMDVISKLLPWHDKALYHGNTVSNYQDLSKNNSLVFDLIRNVDVVVMLDEGSAAISAYGHGVPVIVVDSFSYRQHKADGRTFSVMDTYKTKAAWHVPLEGLAEALDYQLAHPEFMAEERKEVAEAELGISYGDATQNILRYIRNETKNLRPLL